MHNTTIFLAKVSVSSKFYYPFGQLIKIYGLDLHQYSSVFDIIMIIFQLIAIFASWASGVLKQCLFLFGHIAQNFASRHEVKLKPLFDHLMWKYLPTDKISRIATICYFFVLDCLVAAIVLNVSNA